MIYQLSETDKVRLKALKEKIHFHYKDEDAQILDEIISRALINGWMDKDDVYELIEILPKIIPMPVEKSREKAETQNQDWDEYIDEHRAKYKHETERLLQVLSNWVFMESAVHQKNMERCNGKRNLHHIGQGMKK